MPIPAENDAKIFVSIACLDDPDIVDTVADVFAKAKHPARVFVGVCLQIEPNDPSFQALGNFANVRFSTLHYEDARGPIFARYCCEQLLQDEDYYLQIDCHSRFFEDWDAKLITELQKCKQLSDRAVISHYPISIDKMHDPEKLKWIAPANHYRQIDAQGIKSHGRQILIPPSPLKSFAISAAMLFMEGSVKKRIPFDPNLDFGLHTAEQDLYSARLWTNGYDIFAPTIHTVATQYAGSRDRILPDVKRSTAANSANWPEQTWTKVKYLLALDTLEQVSIAYQDSVAAHDFEYGMGKQRSLLDYYRFCEIHEQLKSSFPNYHFRDSP